MASHDLKAPLRAIDSLASWLAEDLEPVMTDGSRQHLALLRQRSARMERLLEDLLAYSRAGRVRADIRQVSVKDLASQVIETLAPPTGFRLECAKDLPHFSTAATPLRQVLLNLVANAIKHHDRPEGVVRLSARNQGAFYEFEVSDDGPGIPETYHARIFDMFRTLQPRDQVEGSGIGLALVRRLVEHYGGRVWTVPSPDRGATFRFTLPCEIEAVGLTHGE